MTLIISAPFGYYVRPRSAISTLGTYTVQHRGGFWYRVWRCLRTLRYNRRMGGWVNRLGLPSPSINRLQFDSLGLGNRKIISIHGFSQAEWKYLVQAIKDRFGDRWLEFNISCPNVGMIGNTIDEIAPAIDMALEMKHTVTVKLPPIRWMALAEPLYKLGVRSFHACNTLPLANNRGGLSGKTLMQYSLWAVNDLRQRFPDVEIIGGGGITSVEDIQTYRKAGANHFAIASMLLNPFRWCDIPDLVAEGAR